MANVVKSSLRHDYADNTAEDSEVAEILSSLRGGQHKAGDDSEGSGPTF